jgi:hypothetical protein
MNNFKKAGGAIAPPAFFCCLNVAFGIVNINLIFRKHYFKAIIFFSQIIFWNHRPFLALLTLFLIEF